MLIFKFHIFTEADNNYQNNKLKYLRHWLCVKHHPECFIDVFSFFFTTTLWGKTFSFILKMNKLRLWEVKSSVKVRNTWPSDSQVWAIKCYIILLMFSYHNNLNKAQEGLNKGHKASFKGVTFGTVVSRNDNE